MKCRFCGEPIKPVTMTGITVWTHDRPAAIIWSGQHCYHERRRALPELEADEGVEPS